jgi:hypothetical protein
MPGLQDHRCAEDNVTNWNENVPLFLNSVMMKIKKAVYLVILV